ncbi:MAG: hypothetical protein CME71_12040 [Halobacteriovorax sp.]|nr:hypothetical protein [Halobacteriovorax sp.]|tara:strand:+ start:538 stop:855 length:318 start_codon:yes stop_codon:yes gene_type:complete
MTLQERTLRQYMELRSQPCLREIAKETGIQQTRVFRILNGSKMRLDEWEIFNQIVVNESACLEKLARECLNELSLEHLSGLQQMMMQKLEWQRSVNLASNRLAQA